MIPSFNLVALKGIPSQETLLWKIPFHEKEMKEKNYASIFF